MLTRQTKPRAVGRSFEILARALTNIEEGTRYTAVMSYRDVLYACVAGVLLGIGFVMPSFWFFSLFSFAPFLWALYRQTTLRRAALLGFLFGCVAYGLSFYPSFWTAQSLSLVGVTGPWLQLLLVAFVWGLTVLIFAISAGLFALVVHILRTRSWLDVLLVASCWPLADWIGAWLFSLVNANKGVLLGPHFSLGSFGYLLAADTTLIQVAWLGGLYALNALIAFCGAILFRWWVTGSIHERIALSILTMLLIIFWIGGYTFLSRVETDAQSVGTLTIAAISTQETNRPSISEEERDVRFARILELIQSIHDADVILLPEGRGTLDRFRSEYGSLARFLDPSLAERTDGPLIVDSVNVRSFDGTLRSRIEYWDFSAWRSSFAYKQFLFPYTETLSEVYIWIAKTLGPDDAVTDLLDRVQLGSGESPEPVRAGRALVSALVCSDGISPILYRDQAAKGAQAFFNLSSQAVYEGSLLMDVLTGRIASVRATESRRWLVLSGNVVPSFAIDPYGRLVAATQKGKDEVLYVKVIPRTDTTPFVRFGEGVLLVPFLIVGVLTAQHLVKRRRFVL